jgi:hypothetical protein
MAPRPAGVSVTILEREMYTETAAARLLRVAPSTLHWWLEGRPLTSLEEVAEDFGLDIDTVRWAQSYELLQIGYPSARSVHDPMARH